MEPKTQVPRAAVAASTNAPTGSNVCTAMDDDIAFDLVEGEQMDGSLNNPLIHERESSDDAADAEKQGTFVGAVANLANAAIGAGVLAFPYAFKCCGVILGLIVTLSFAAVMAYTLHMLGEVSAATRKAVSYQVS